MQFLGFCVGGEEYGVDILRVQEIRSWEPVTRIPNTVSYEIGGINLRGAIVPIIDLREKFGLSQFNYTPTTVVIVLQVGHRKMGIVVDSVSNVIEVDKQDIQAAPAVGSKVKVEYISGLISVNQRMVVLLNTDTLLALEALYEKIRQKQVRFNASGWKDKFNFYKKMSLLQKMGLAGLTLILPALLLMYFLYTERQHDIGFAEKEILGVTYLQPVKSLQVALIKHAGQRLGVLESSQVDDRIQELATMEIDIDRMIADIDQVDKKYGHILKTAGLWGKIKQQWAALQKQQTELSRQQIHGQHEKLLQEILDLMVWVGNQSNLILDPDLDSYYLMDLEVLQFPKLVQAIGQARDYRLEMMNSVGQAQPRMIQLMIAKQNVEQLSNSVLQDYKTAMLENPRLKSVFERDGQLLQQNIEQFVQQISITGENLDTKLSTASLHQLADNNLDLTSELYDKTAEQLKALLKNRITTLQAGLHAMLGFVSLTIIIAIFIFWRLTRYFHRQMDTVTIVDPVIRTIV